MQTYLNYNIHKYTSLHRLYYSHNPSRYPQKETIQKEIIQKEIIQKEIIQKEIIQKEIIQNVKPYTISNLNIS